MRFLSLCLALSLAFVCGSAVADDAPIPASAFFQRAQFSRVKISPDGHYLALVGPVKGDDMQTQLFFVDLSSMQVMGHYSLKEQQQIEDLWWLTNNRIVFTTNIQTGSFDVPLSTYVIWGADVDGGHVDGIAGRSSVLQLPADRLGHIIYQTWDQPSNATILDMSQYRHPNFIRGVKSPLANGWLYPDNDEQIRLTMGFNEKTIEPEMFEHEAGAQGSDWKDISVLVKSEPRYSSYGPMMFTADSKEFYYKGLTPAGTLGLYLVDPVTAQKTLLYSDPGFDIDNEFARSDWLLSSDGRSLVAFKYTAELPQWIVVNKDVPEAKELAALQEAFVGQSVLITSQTVDGSRSIIFVSSDRNPGEYYLYDAKAQKVQFLFNTLPGIHADDMAEMTPVSFKARDGKTIHGYLTMPRGKTKDVPLIIHPHGGPFGIRDEWGFDPEVQYLAYHGYAVLQVNYRGSGGYGDAFQEGGYKQWGGAMQDDLTDATHWAIQQGYTDAKHICIYGASYGGYAALEAVVKEPDLYQCAVGYAGVYDLVKLRGAAHTLHGMTLIPFTETTLGDDIDVLKSNSPAFHVDKIKAALFLAHGGADETVPIAHADELRDALDKINKPYEWVYFRNEVHGFYTLDHKLELYTKMLSFLDKNIGQAAPAH
jgi:dipeptidyl aminopeptidase/acylaminoacyl peptidase